MSNTMFDKITHTCGTLILCVYYTGYLFQYTTFYDTLLGMLFGIGVIISTIEVN
jgi:hypothetical protein